MKRATLLASLLLLAPVAAADAGPGSSLPALVDQAAARLATGDRPGAQSALAAARGLAHAWPAPPAPATMPAALLVSASAALDRGDTGAARNATSAARAALVHGALGADLAALHAGNASWSWRLSEFLDLPRAPGLAAWERSWRADPADATLQDRVAQRLLDRVAEEGRIALRLAEVASQAGLAGEAAPPLHAAEGLARALSPEAARLPPATQLLWNATLADLAASPDRAPVAAAAATLHPLLRAVGLGRTLARLDDLGDDILVAALAWERSVAWQRAAPTPATLQLQDAARDDLDRRYAASKAELFLLGEGSLEPLQVNLTRLDDGVAASASAGALREAVEGTRGDLQRVAHLTFGAFAKLEFVHAAPGVEVVPALIAGRFPPEGIASWDVEMRWDPAIGEVTRVLAAPNTTLVRDERDPAAGRLVLRAEASPSLQAGAVLARITMRALGEPKEETALSFASLRLVAMDGREPELFLVSPGRLIVAEIFDDENATEEDPRALSNPALGKRSPNAPALAAFCLAALGGAAARRRRR